MELAEGENLAERIARGPVPLDDALAIARQIAEGLEEAHEKGIVHRDLKPANVIVSAGGAGQDPRLRARPGVADEDGHVAYPTGLAHHDRATDRRWVLLGTAGHEPEQARGRPTDTGRPTSGRSGACCSRSHEPQPVRCGHRP